MAKSIGEFMLMLDKFAKAVERNAAVAYPIHDEILKEIEALLERIEQLEKEESDRLYNEMMLAELGNSGE